MSINLLDIDESTEGLCYYHHNSSLFLRRNSLNFSTMFKVQKMHVKLTRQHVYRAINSSTLQEMTTIQTFVLYINPTSKVKHL